MTAPVPPVASPFGIEDPFAPFQTEAAEIKAQLATDPRAALRRYALLQEGERTRGGSTSDVLRNLSGVQESDAFRAAGFGGTPYDGEDGLLRRLAGDDALTTPAQLAEAEAAQGASVRDRYAALQAAEEAQASAPTSGVVDGPLSGEDAFALANGRDGLNQLQKRIQALPRGDRFRDDFLAGRIQFDPETRQFVGQSSAPSALTQAQANYEAKPANDLRTYLPSAAAMTAPAQPEQLADDPFSAFGTLAPSRGGMPVLKAAPATMAGGDILPSTDAAPNASVGAAALAPVANADPFPYSGDPDPLQPQNPTPSEPVPGTPSGGPIGGPGGGPATPETPVPGGTKPYGGPRTDIPVPPAPGGTRPYTGPRGVIPAGNAFGRPASAGANPSGGMFGGALGGLAAMGRKRQSAPMRNNAPGRPYSMGTALAAAPDFRKVGRKPMGPNAPTF